MLKSGINLKNETLPQNNIKNAVLVCEFCGSYSVQKSEKFQVCNCNSILILEGQVQPNAIVINDCKMCTLFAVESGS